MQQPAPNFPSPTGGASLVLSFRLHSQGILVVGSNTLAASRAFAALEADADVVVAAKGGLAAACDEIRWRVEREQVRFLDLDAYPGCPSADGEIQALDSIVQNLKNLSLVCVTDTVAGKDVTLRRDRASAADIYRICHARNVPVNVTDMPELCDFSFTSMHRFTDPATGSPTPLQIGVTTNGEGCRLASRVRREIVSRLPKEVGGAVKKVGKLRALAKARELPAIEAVEDVEGDLDEDNPVSTPNRPVPQRSSEETQLEAKRRQMKWVAQVSEYWPLPRLANMSDEEMDAVLSDGAGLGTVISAPSDFPLHHRNDSEPSSLHSLDLTPPPATAVARGKILLVGSGPGAPSLLTLATHAALTQHAHLVLADKLVPAAVLDLIPPSVKVRIARKFPGNAEASQNEMMEAAVEAARQGLTVVRLKQGDPTVYGRAGEEVLYFRARGFEPLVVPGVSSALAAPIFAGIPVTQRGVAASFVVCTGVGRQGRDVQLPGYVRARTLVVLMGVARLPHVLDALQADADSAGASARREGAAYPPHLPIAIIERASMPDQRVICSTLRNVQVALESSGEQRPPGMMVIGWSVLCLWDKGDVNVLEEGAEERDEERISTWLGGEAWRVKEGLDEGWDDL